VRRERFRAVHQLVVKLCPGIIFPTPYPQGYGATPPPPRPPQKRARRCREHARAGPGWQCRLCRTRASEGSNTVGRPVLRGGRRASGAPADETRTRSPLATPSRGPRPGERHRFALAATLSGTIPATRARFGVCQGPDAASRPPADNPRPLCFTAHRSVMRRCGIAAPPSPRRPATPSRGYRTRHGSRGRGSAPARLSQGGCAPGVTGYSTHNRWFSANFARVPDPSPDGRTPHRPPGRNGPRGTLSPDADGPRCRGALPCALRE
jgi:hypothetical protein